MTMLTDRPVALTSPAPAAVDADLWTKIRQRYLFYWEQQSGAARLWASNTWLGVPVEKLPTDAWMYQELIWRLRPDVLVETGTLFGGSAAFFASLMDLAGHGEVLSVDRLAWDGRPIHPRVTYLTGDSADPGMVAAVTERCAGKRVLVVLDSDHSTAHVAAELDAYAPLVSPGCYLVVEDTGLTEATNRGAGQHFGAAVALAAWLPQHPEFEPDPACERFLITSNPGGYLRRKGDGDGA